MNEPRKLVSRSALARQCALPLATTARRLAKLGIEPDAELVVATGGNVASHPLFAESRLDEIQRAITGLHHPEAMSVS